MTIRDALGWARFCEWVEWWMDVTDHVTDRLTERPAPPTDPVEADWEAAYWPDWRDDTEPPR